MNKTSCAHSLNPDGYDRRHRLIIRRCAGLLWFLAGGVGLTSTASGQETIVLQGEVPADGVDHFFVPFEVPDGTVEIEVRHDDLSEQNILDWGLVDERGAFRGWGGGNTEPAVVGVDAASRSYLAGPIEPGTWSVVVGKAKIAEEPALYEIEIELRTTATLPAQTERTPYVPASALESTARWYAGDFHVHSLESGDARPPIDEIATFARAAGLDFVHLSDHNTVSQHDFIVDAQARHPNLLLVPGTEWTSYDGHASTIGLTTWVDHKVGQPGVTIQGAIDAVRADGALFSINHPALDLASFCIGCAWEHDVDPTTIDGVEIGTGGWEPTGRIFTPRAIEFWDALCDAGSHAAPLGGSDDHKAGVGLGNFDSPIGSPTTMVYADELSVAALIEGIRNNLTVVKLQGPSDPMVDMALNPPRAGDTVSAQRVNLTATITGAAVGSDQIRLVKNGVPDPGVDITDDPFVFEVTLESPPSGDDRYRLEVVSGERYRTVTGHFWLRTGDALPVGTPDAGGDPEPDVGAPADPAGDVGGEGPPPGTPATTDHGCSCSVHGKSPRPIGWPWLLVALVVARSRSLCRRSRVPPLPGAS